MGANFTAFNGMQTGGINPYFAANQQPMYAPGVPAMGQVNQPQQFVQQNGVYVPQNQQVQQPVAQAQQPQGYGIGGVAQMGTNPIGYVEQNQVQPDFTNTLVQQNQTVAMPGPSVAAPQTPPMPEAPKNPNLQEPAKN